MNTRSQVGTLLAVFLALSPLAVAAAPRLTASVGFGGHFVPETLTPLRVHIFGIGNAFSGFLLVTQSVGNPWRGEAQSRMMIPLQLLGAMEQESVIPIYDFIDPLRISLLSEEQDVLAETTVDLRAHRKQAPFPVAVGDLSSHLDDSFVIADSTTLPVNWAGYEAVSSLWIGALDEGISQPQWKAIGQWVLAGGTIVLFSGAGFYRLDSPFLRALLPLAEPTVTVVDGVSVLGGEMRHGAANVIDRGALPLAISHRYGAGAVLLCTVGPADVARNEVSQIAAAVAPADLLSLASQVEELQEATVLQRPGFPMVGLLVVVSLSGFTLVVYRTRTTKQTLVGLLIISGALCVLSGLYTNQTKTAALIYDTKTKLSIQNYFGFVINYTDLFGTDTGTNRTTVSTDAAFIQTLPRNLLEHDLTIAVQDGEARLSLDRGEHRSLRAFSSGALPVALSAPETGKVRVVNGLKGPLATAIVIRDGAAFPIGEVPVGEKVFPLRQAVSLRDAVLGQEHHDALFRSLCAQFFFGSGTWLVGVREQASVQHIDGTRTKVRDLLVVAVAGGDRD